MNDHYNDEVIKWLKGLAFNWMYYSQKIREISFCVKFMENKVHAKVIYYESRAFKYGTFSPLKLFIKKSQQQWQEMSFSISCIMASYTFLIDGPQIIEVLGYFYTLTI